MNRRLSIIGMALTFAYLFLLLLVFNGRLTEILLLKPNEIGDLLAGMFGPLAILWLILGFFQQGIELRQNTDALKMQADELKLLVAAENAQMELMRDSQNPFFQIVPSWRREALMGARLKNVGYHVSNLVITGSSGFGNFQHRNFHALGQNQDVSLEIPLVSPTISRVAGTEEIYWISVEFQTASGLVGQHIFDYVDDPQTDYGKFIFRKKLADCQE